MLSIEQSWGVFCRIMEECAHENDEMCGPEIRCKKGTSKKLLSEKDPGQMNLFYGNHIIYRACYSKTCIMM